MIAEVARSMFSLNYLSRSVTNEKLAHLHRSLLAATEGWLYSPAVRILGKAKRWNFKIAYYATGSVLPGNSKTSFQTRGRWKNARLPQFTPLAPLPPEGLLAATNANLKFIWSNLKKLALENVPPRAPFSKCRTLRAFTWIKLLELRTRPLQTSAKWLSC